MADTNSAVYAARSGTTPSGLLIITAAVEWTIFFTALVFNHEGGLSVIQWFALAAFFMGALISLIFAYLHHQSQDDPRGIYWLFSTGMLIWSTAGFFWPSVAPHFSFLTITAYTVLALQLTPQAARPYALPAILSLWAVAAAGSFVALVPLSLILVLFTFMIETVLSHHFEHEADLGRQLTQISAALSVEQQISAGLKSELELETANSYLLQADHRAKTAAFNKIAASFQILANQATGSNVLFGLLIEARTIIQANWGVLFTLNQTTGRVDRVYCDPDSLPEFPQDKVEAIKELFPTIDQSAATQEDGDSLLISRINVDREVVNFICLGRSSEYPMWSATDLETISLLVMGARGFISEKILAAVQEDDLDRQALLDRALQDLYQSQNAAAVLQKTANQIGQALHSKRVRVRLLSDI